MKGLTFRKKATLQVQKSNEAIRNCNTHLNYILKGIQFQKLICFEILSKIKLEDKHSNEKNSLALKTKIN